MRQRLDVLDEGGAAPQAAFGHSGRFAQWDRSGLPDPVDDGARLTGDEAVCGDDDSEIRAVKPDPSAFAQRRIDARVARRDGRP